MKPVDLIIPVYNESGGLASFHSNLQTALLGLPYEFRLFYVNDGSSDETANVLAGLAERNPEVYPIELSRNFGHQAALSAGLDACNADAVIMMDGDGEHPPELIPEMLRLYEMGYDVVQTQRVDSGRRGVTFKRITGSAFYWLISRLGETTVLEGAADYRLLSGNALAALRRMPEYHRFFRGMVSWIGFRTVILPYKPATRLAGQSKYSLRKMLRLASDGMFSFSLAPLRLALVGGCAFLFLAFLEVLYVLSFFLRGMQDRLVPGWSSLMMVMLASSGISMVVTGILGVYTGMIFQEVKKRPVYLARPPQRASVDHSVCPQNSFTVTSNISSNQESPVAVDFSGGVNVQNGSMLRMRENSSGPSRAIKRFWL
jgi:glycosyltransferase involved in cell wall biosynthesis